ncbi:MAG: CIA30 family protein [Proteobacteria bacterium]|nr:CIA30 family protein [Pseudomonadota bacterium]MDA1024028.1 CIA30 family protein [Pseudomonadota bacterium]
MELKPSWEFVADTVMGGVSSGQISTEEIAGRVATRLTGDISLENNGGFVQMAFDINEDGSAFDASRFNAIELDVIGNGETYDLRLRTTDLTRSWQSYRASFEAPSTWTSVAIPLTDFIPHKTDIQFDQRRLRRVGILAIGRVAWNSFSHCYTRCV